MKLTVVGFWGGYPGKEEATSGYLLEEDGFKLLIDCGSGVLSQVQKYTSLDDIDAVILSHYHHDHIADIGPLQFARHIQTFLKDDYQTLPIYGHAMNRDGFNKLSFHDATKGVHYSLQQPLAIGPFKINFIETKHPEPCAAMAITHDEVKIVYTADTSLFDDLITFSTNADLLIAECSLYAQQNGESMGHMNSRDVGYLAKQAGVKDLLLTHLPHYGDHKQLIEEAEQIYKGPKQLALSGWSWTK